MPKTVQTALGVAMVEDIGKGIHRYWWDDHVSATDVCVTNERGGPMDFTHLLGPVKNTDSKPVLQTGRAHS
jgi:hypothetical protein